MVNMEKNGKKRIIIQVFFGLFCAVFIISGYMLISNEVGNRKAANAYHDLRTVFRKNVSTSATPEQIESMVTEKIPLPTATVTPQPKENKPEVIATSQPVVEQPTTSIGANVESDREEATAITHRPALNRMATNEQMLHIAEKSAAAGETNTVGNQKEVSVLMRRFVMNRAVHAKTAQKLSTNNQDTDAQTLPEADQSSFTVTQVPLVSMDFSELQQINSEIIGWIWSEGCSMDYPIMQTYDNSYYMYHLYNREYNPHGSIFQDYRCAEDFTGKSSVLYGHAIRDEKAVMFGKLKEYKNQEFYDANPTMMLYTPNGDYLIELFSGTVEDGNYEFIRFEFEDDADFIDYVEDLKSRSTFKSDVEVSADDQIISLLTCSYETLNARYMVVGKLVRLYGSWLFVPGDTE